MSRAPDPDVSPVADEEWEVVAWLFQAFRHDLSGIVAGYPLPDGRYNHAKLDDFPSPGRIGYLARVRDPQRDQLTPVGFALVSGLDDERRHLQAFWTAPVTRRTGLGTHLALQVIGRHPGAWAIAFQQHNPAAGPFWRKVAEHAFGPGGEAWTEVLREVPGRPDLPPDHWIETT